LKLFAGHDPAHC